MHCLIRYNCKRHYIWNIFCVFAYDQFSLFDWLKTTLYNMGHSKRMLTLYSLICFYNSLFNKVCLINWDVFMYQRIIGKESWNLLMLGCSQNWCVLLANEENNYLDGINLNVSLFHLFFLFQIIYLLLIFFFICIKCWKEIQSRIESD